MKKYNLEQNKITIINLFNSAIKGTKSDTIASNIKHAGKEGHWLEKNMGLKLNGKNSPDFLGFEMKNNTTSKTTFGDWSADYYIYKNDENFTRDNFLKTFGKPNPKKNGRYSWSGEPCPKINIFNSFGQKLIIDENNNIFAIYSYLQDKRLDKKAIVPLKFQRNHLILAKWDSNSIQVKLENKFNQNGWFKCLKNKNGVYTNIVFGNPISFKNWIKSVRVGDVFFDSGMYQGNIRPYSMWRANNKFWEDLVISKY